MVMASSDSKILILRQQVRVLPGSFSTCSFISCRLKNKRPSDPIQASPPSRDLLFPADNPAGQMRHVAEPQLIDQGVAELPVRFPVRQ